MKELTVRESIEWWRMNVPGVPGWENRPQVTGADASVVQVEDEPMRRAAAIARLFVQLTWPPTGAYLVMIPEYGVWTSSEHVPLYASWQRASGRPISQSHPGYLFENSEQEECVSLVLLGLVYGWGLQGGSGLGKVFYLDHDGNVALTGLDEQDRRALRRVFSDG